ncbi:MAG TPA: S-layer protein domain-containing protein [Methanothrix soehngenii]|nr:S-layer protein domain-containing protein [Methanothrix soehngenii]
MRSNFAGMKSGVAAERSVAEGVVRRAVGILAILAILVLLANAMGARGQVSEALVRGSFSEGNGSWNAETFGWFYYDLDEGTGGERLTIEAEDREVKEGHLVYSSEVWTEEFDFDEWGRYEAVAFLGKRYLAGYPDSNFTDAVSAMEDGELWEVLIDSDAALTATTEEPLFLLAGYSIEVGGVSSDGNEAYLILKRFGIEVDRAVVRAGDTYVYEAEGGEDGDDDFPLILVHVSAAMEGSNRDIVDFNGIFQVQDLPTYRLEAGDIFGLMEVATLSERKIELENAEDLVLRRDSTIVLLGNLMLRVRDTPSLVYYPQGAITEYGVYEIRGTVYSENSNVPISTATGEFVGYAQARWNYENFTGFYFDDDKKLGFEPLIIHRTDGRFIRTARSDGGRLVEGAEYAGYVQYVDFEFDPWGSYQALCFLGQPWFVGYGPGAKLDVEEKSMLEQNQIGLVLIDTDQRDRAVAGEVYFLGEGYTLYIRDVVKDDVEKDEIFIELSKNNQLVDSAVVESNSTYIYKRDVGDVKDLPIIALHVESVYSDRDDQFAIIDGLFQISDSQYLTIEYGDELGELTIYNINPDLGVFLANYGEISLRRDSTVAILPGMSIKVADNDTLRYYIYVNEYVLPTPEIIDVYLPGEPVPSVGKANFSVFVLGGNIVSITAETVDSQGRRMVLGDLTASGVGKENQWLYSWQWNATVPALSDDRTILPVLDLQGGVLQVNNTTEPVQVLVGFDGAGRIDLIQGTAGEIYYISPDEYETLGAPLSYVEMASNETLRKRYIKVEPGVSEIEFFQIVDGTAILDNTSHKLWYSPQGIEPHLISVGAPPGRYEIRLQVENPTGSVSRNGLYFDVSGPDLRSAAVGSATVAVDERFSLPLEIPASENETRMTLSFDPDRLSFEGIDSVECDIEQDLSEKGEIALAIPANCTAINLTFRADGDEGLSDVEIVELVGIDVDEIVNGTVNVTAPQRPEGRAPAPGAAFALLVVGLAFFLAGRRRMCG